MLPKLLRQVNALEENAAKMTAVAIRSCDAAMKTAMQHIADMSNLEDRLFTLKSENTTLVTAFVALLAEFLRLANRVTQDRLETVNDLGHVREDTALQLTKIVNAISTLQATDVGTQHVLAGLLGEVIQLADRVTKGQFTTVGQDKERKDTLLDLQRTDLANQQSYVGLANNVVYLTDRVTRSQLGTLQDKLEIQDSVHDMMETGDALQCFEIGLAGNLIRVSDRLTQAQNAISEGSALVNTVDAVALNSSGVKLGQLKLTPVTIANNVSAIPAGTALAFVLEEVDG